MIRTIFRLAILLLILNAAWQLGPPFWQYWDFKRAVEHMALTGREKTPEQLEDDVFALAVKREIPVERQGIRVTREQDHTYIDVGYSVAASPIPGWNVTKAVEIHADGWHVRAR